MGRPVAVTPQGEATEEVLCRRYRQLELRLCVPAVDLLDKVSTRGPVVTAEGERIQAIGEQLRRDAAKVVDPAERLELAEHAYLSVFSRLPWEGGGPPGTEVTN